MYNVNITCYVVKENIYLVRLLLSPSFSLFGNNLHYIQPILKSQLYLIIVPRWFSCFSNKNGFNLLGCKRKYLLCALNLVCAYTLSVCFSLLDEPTYIVPTLENVLLGHI